jgi:hypothetical protein
MVSERLGSDAKELQKPAEKGPVTVLPFYQANMLKLRLLD